MFFIPTPRELSIRQCVGQWRVNGMSTKYQTKLIGPPKMVQKSSDFHEKSKIFAIKVGEAKNCQNNATRVSPRYGNITEKEKLSDKLQYVIRSGN